jgi:hypothetical protein
MERLDVIDVEVFQFVSADGAFAVLQEKELYALRFAREPPLLRFHPPKPSSKSCT